MLGEAYLDAGPASRRVRADRKAPRGATATDLVLTVTQILREPASSESSSNTSDTAREPSARRPRDDREHVPRVRGNVRLLPRRRRDAALSAPHGTAGRADRARRGVLQGERALARPGRSRLPTRKRSELDLSTVEPSLAGPRRPQDRVPLREAKQAFIDALPSFGADYGNAHDEAVAETFPASDPLASAAPGHEPETADAVISTMPPLVLAERSAIAVTLDGETFELNHGAVVIAAITSCTNTSNPAVMIGAGLLAKKAVERGLARKPWVKSSSRLARRWSRSNSEGRTDAVPGGARLLHRRVRLHDLHRETRAHFLSRSRRESPQGDLVACAVSRATGTSRPGSIRR